jgi:hypothetical protein
VLGPAARKQAEIRNSNESHNLIENKWDIEFERGESHYLIENKDPKCLICLTFFQILGESHYVVENSWRLGKAELGPVNLPPLPGLTL